MAKKNIKFTLDTIDSRYSPVGTVKQLDSVFFYIKITENGVTKDLTGQTIKLFAIKEDKKIVEQTTKINITNQREGLVEIELLNAAIQVHGFTYFELEISDSNGIISTADFILRVNKKVGSDESIESTNEVSTLKKVETYVAQAKIELKNFKELQASMLETNNSINTQEASRVEAEKKRVAAESEREQKIKEFNSRINYSDDRFLNLKNKYNINMDIIFKKGSLLTTTGKEIESNNRIVSSLIEVEDSNINVCLDDYNCKYMIFIYSITATNEVKFKSYIEWTKEDLVLRPGYAYRLLLAHDDDKEIEDINELSVFIKFNKYITSSSIEKINNNVLNISSSLNEIDNEIPLMLSECTKFKKLLNPNIAFMFKNINISTGVWGGNTTTRISSIFINVGKNSILRIEPKENIKFIIVTYNEHGEFQLAEKWITKTYFKIYDDNFKIRLLLAYEDDREISQDFNYTDFITLNIRDKVKGKFIESTTLKPSENFNLKLGSVNTVTGVETINDTRISTEITLMQNCDIEIEPVEDSQFLVVFYDTNMNVLNSTSWSSSKTNLVITEPRYIKILFSYKDNRVLSNRELELFKKCIKSITNKNLSQTNDENGYYFRSHGLPAIPVGSNAIGHNNFIESYWEDLRSNYPNYITRNEIIKDTSNSFSIYEYIYTPKNYNKTVFLTAGIHGDEYEGFYGLYYFMKNIVENSYRHKQLRDIALNTRFIIIPVLNPWGVENRTRRTSRIANANNNYDVMFDAREYEHDGTFGFSENESNAVKLIADKYEGELDLYFDFHTDFYDPQFGNYILLDCNSSNRKICENLIIDEIKYLKDKYNFITEPKPNLVNINKRCSSFKYMNIVRKVPGAIIEVGTGRISPVGSSESITRSVDWYTNVLCEHIKNDYKKNKHNKDLEKAICEGRIKAYSNAVLNNISDEGLQVWLDYNDFETNNWKNKADRGEVVLDNIGEKTEDGVVFNNSLIKLPKHKYSDYTMFFKGKISSDGRIISSENDNLRLTASVSSESTRYNILQDENPMYSSLLKYNKEISICVRSKEGVKDLYVNGEPFLTIIEKNQTQTNLLIGAKSDKTKAIGMKAKTIMLYDRALKDDEIGFVFKAI